MKLPRRIRLLLALGVTIAVGMASRKFHTPQPWHVQKELGDVLWATAAYWAIAFAVPVWRPGRVAIAAMVLAMLSEFTQLSHAGWLESLRQYRVGQFLLGSGFSWLDMAMYPIGAALAWVIDRFVCQPQPKR